VPQAGPDPVPHKALCYKEGAAATVSVRRLAGRLALAIDGKVDASNAGDRLTQRLLGILPILIHGHADQLCVIGLGSGVTVASAIATGLVRHADVVEISPEVVAASALFSNENGSVLASPRVRLIVGDGRSHLQLSTRRYNVIVSEPSNPWMAGVAALFTREFFEAARLKLGPGGILCQWAHLYDMSDADLRSIVRTFASVFPQTTMWRVGDGDLLLIGTTANDIESQLANVAERLRQKSATAVLGDVAIQPATAPFPLLSLFAGRPPEVARYGDAAAIQTDDRMDRVGLDLRSVDQRKRPDHPRVDHRRTPSGRGCRRGARSRCATPGRARRDGSESGILFDRLRLLPQGGRARRRRRRGTARRVGRRGRPQPAEGAPRAARGVGQIVARPMRPCASSCRGCVRPQATSRRRLPRRPTRAVSTPATRGQPRSWRRCSPTWATRRGSRRWPICSPPGIRAARMGLTTRRPRCCSAVASPKRQR
jgi:hypothetical protein